MICEQYHGPARRALGLAAICLAGVGALFLSISGPAQAQEPPPIAFDRKKVTVYKSSAIAFARARQQAGVRVKTANDKVILGQPAAAGAYPFQVSLVLSDTKRGKEFEGHYCGGSLIGADWVLTAAHCVTEDDGAITAPKALDIYAGSHNFKGGDRIPVKAVFRHPDYNADFTENDVALIQLARAPRKGLPIGTIRLVETGTRDTTEAPGTDALIIGWGTTEDDELSQNLLQARLKLVDTKVCNQNLTVRRILDQIEGDTGSFLTQGLRMTDDQVLSVAKVMLANAGTLVTKGMMCAGDPNPPKDAERSVDTCQGDSGGPLFVRGADGKFTQVGIVSWGEGCGLPKVYGVYARISDYLDFIQKTVK